MAARHGRDNRDVIPRWRPFGKAVRAGELASYRTSDDRNSSSNSDIIEATKAFEDDPGVYTAGDLLSHAVVTQSQLNDAISAAASLVLESTESTEVIRNLAERAVTPADGLANLGDPTFDQASARLRARHMRAIVRREPGNAVRWVDLALAHVNLGQLQSAEEELKIALRLAPDNRHVLRSATRFYLIRDQPDRAQWLLRRSPATAHDPWLQAAELAVSELADSTSRRISEARRTLDRANFFPRHLSELASELATAELRAGRVRHAKRYMRTALIDPTENALAQAEWAHSHGIVVADTKVDDVLWSFEAEALGALERGDYESALSAGHAWQLDQPFAADAATFTSYIATVGTGDWAAAAQAARQGLVANPQDIMLLNNLIFNLASLGDLEACLSHLEKLPRISDIGTRATVGATKGLVAFRLGEYELGRRLYVRSAEIFRKLQDKERERIARILLIREELRAGLRAGPDAVKAADKLVAESKSPELEMWRDRIIASANLQPAFSIAKQPSNWTLYADKVGHILTADTEES